MVILFENHPNAYAVILSLLTLFGKGFYKTTSSHVVIRGVVIYCGKFIGQTIKHDTRYNIQISNTMWIPDTKPFIATGMDSL